jgi:hypothetical protein
MKVLVVEDETDMMESIVSAFSPEGSMYISNEEKKDAGNILEVTIH